MTQAIAVRKDLDMSGWEAMRSQAVVLVNSGFLPKAVNTAEKALAIALKGRELGLPMMQSITSIHIIDGKPSISAELMAALVLQRIPGAVLQCVETSEKQATYEAGRPGHKVLRMSFTWDEAVKAGVTGKDNWKKYPAAMLRARCCSAICRVVFPDAIMGVYTPDELGAITTEEGEVMEGVIDVTPKKADSVKPSVTPPPSKNEPANIKDLLKKELGEYCLGDTEKMKAVLKEISFWKNSEGKEYFMTSIDKGTDKWCGTALGNLRKKIEKAGANKVAPENCTLAPVSCEHSTFIDSKAHCTFESNKGLCGPGKENEY